MAQVFNRVLGGCNCQMLTLKCVAALIFLDLVGSLTVLLLSDSSAGKLPSLEVLKTLKP